MWHNSPGKMGGETILVVEDDQDVSIVLSTILETAGYRVVTARDGDGAIRQARAEGPSLITLDMGMPGISGATVLEALRREPRTLRTPVVVITGSGIAESGFLLAQGAQAYLQKPFEPTELIQVVRELIGR